MHRNGVFRGHVEEHASEPVRCDRCDEIGDEAELGAAEGGGDRVATEGYRIFRGDMLFVADRHVIRDKGHVDVSLPNEQCLHEHAPCVDKPSQWLAHPLGSGSADRRSEGAGFFHIRKGGAI
jgi:hypothetical protein